VKFDRLLTSNLQLHDASYGTGQCIRGNVGFGYTLGSAHYFWAFHDVTGLTIKTINDAMNSMYATSTANTQYSLAGGADAWGFRVQPEREPGDERGLRLVVRGDAGDGTERGAGYDDV